MALITSIPPAPSLDALRERVGDVGPGDLRPHRVLDLGLDAVRAGGGLAAASLVGWRYAVTRPDGSRVVAEVGVDEETDEHAFRHESVGDAAEVFLAAHDEAAGHDAVRREDYEVALLRVPAGHVQAVWFHGDGHDFLVPLEGAPAPFEAGRPLEVEEFERLLAEVAAGIQPQF